MTAPERRRSRLRRAWPWLKYVVGLGLAALAFRALTGQRGELAAVSTTLTHLNWWWVVLAVVAESGSLVAFGIVQRRLLEAGGVEIPTLRLTGVTLASTAIANSMPGGPVVASVFAFRQYRRRGADDALAGWTLAAVFVSSSVSLALVAAVGVGIAGAEGASDDLVVVTVVVLVGALAMGAVFLQRRALVWVVTAVVRSSRRLVGWPRGEAGAVVDAFVRRLTTVTLSLRQTLSVLAWGLGNWVLDCSCLALSFLAVGAGIPWRGLLLTYGAAQLAANLPITPGGLGVVEGSLAIGLTHFGGAQDSIDGVVLLYRILSFWAELPIGWATWGAFTWARRPARVDVPLPSGVAEEVGS